MQAATQPTCSTAGRICKRTDHTFLLLNGLLLLFVALVPFTTELIASYAQAKDMGIGLRQWWSTTGRTC